MFLEENNIWDILDKVIRVNKKSLKDCSYMVEIGTYKTLYMCDELKAEFSKATINGCCYEQFRGRKTPCEPCLLVALENNEEYTYEDILYEELGVRANLNVVKLNIDGKKVGYCSLSHVVELEAPVGVDSFTSDVMLHNALTASTNDYIYMCDIKNNLWHFPKAMVEEFGLPGEVLYDAGNLWKSVVHENDIVAYEEDLAKVFAGESELHDLEYRAKNKVGEWVWVRCRGKMEYNSKGEAVMFAGIVTILGKKNKIDYISGLLNKYEFEKLIQEEISKNTLNIGILLLGIDDFKHINNLYGWEFGDLVLRLVADKMQKILPTNIDLFRLNSDVYGILLKNTNEKELVMLYETIQCCFNEQLEIQGNKFFCTFSGGCVIESEKKETVYGLIKKAEYAIDSAKANGKNKLSFYSSEGLIGKERKLKLIQSLRESVYSNFKNFEVFYQPQVIVETKEIISAEALLRYKCEEFGDMGPDEFVPILEETGLIHQVGKWVLEGAIKTCKQWREVVPNFVLSVNVSYLQILEKNFTEYITNVFSVEDLPYEAIHLEITESCIAYGSNSLNAAFEEIKKLGIVLEMDDFGTGYSSLEVLKNKPADVVKIDRAFVRDITTSKFDATFISFVVALCHTVGIKVCLEGVETWEEYELIKQMNLDIVQGYLFGKPVDEKTFKTKYVLKK